MTTKNGQEPAVPIVGHPDPYQRGLTKRELIAAMAMQGYLAGRNVNSNDCNHVSVASACIRYADVLLEELGKPEEK